MPVITENEMISCLSAASNVDLIEPPYNRKYMPLGLAKISSYCKTAGVETRFSRFCMDDWADLICITSVFTYDWEHLLDAIRHAAVVNPSAKILVGGVCASLNAKKLLSYFNDKIFVYKGYSKILDVRRPDYDGHAWDAKEGWNQFSFVFTTRGCPNKCSYCVVPHIEPERWMNEHWKYMVDINRPFLMISDNNLSSWGPEHLKSIIEFAGSNRLRLLFDNGFDGKYIDHDIADILGNAMYINKGCRTAFDRIEEDGIFQVAVGELVRCGVPKEQIMAYVLFNYTDSPKGAEYRCLECTKIGITPYPQLFMKLNAFSKEVVPGGKWTAKLAKAFKFFWGNSWLYKNTTFGRFIMQEGSNLFKLTDKDVDYYFDWPIE